MKKKNYLNEKYEMSTHMKSFVRVRTEGLHVGRHLN